MANSSGSRGPRKVPDRSAPDRPKKPYPGFPLTPHASGKWMKKIRGTIYYFSNWASRVDGVLQRVDGDGAKEAEAAYNAVRDDLHAGRTPRVEGDGLRVGQLCNHFLTAKARKKESGELGLRMFADYKGITDLLVETFGPTGWWTILPLTTSANYGQRWLANGRRCGSGTRSSGPRVFSSWKPGG